MRDQIILKLIELIGAINQNFILFSLSYYVYIYGIIYNSI